jgi:hypothetical protein
MLTGLLGLARWLHRTTGAEAPQEQLCRVVWGMEAVLVVVLLICSLMQWVDLP